METTVFEKDNDYMDSDEVAELLVKLYADYVHHVSFVTQNSDYAKAVAIAIRMLTD